MMSSKVIKLQYAVSEVCDLFLFFYVSLKEVENQQLRFQVSSVNNIELSHAFFIYAVS